MSEIRQEPHNGRCVCRIQDEFQQKHGYTVDQWYERNPEVTPWILERCPGCPEKHKDQGETKPVHPTVWTVAPQEPQIATPVVEARQPVRQQENNTMCEPTQTYTYSQPSTPVSITQGPNPFPFIGWALALTGVVGAVGVVLATTLFFGLAILAAMPIAAALMLAWRHRATIWQGAMTVVNAVDTAVMFPFVLVWKGATRAARTIKVRRERREAAPTIRLLTGSTVQNNPARLLEVRSVEPIMIPAKKQPVKVTRKAKVK